MKSTLTWVLSGLVLGLAGTLVASAKPSADARTGKQGASAFSIPTPYRTMLNKYCITCHNDTNNIPAGQPLYLDEANLDNVGQDDALWEMVASKLSVNAMPPQGKEHPGAAELQGFRDWLLTALDKVASSKQDPGDFPVHRLNRVEYGNAIRDIFGVDFDASKYLSTDAADYGFDNVAAALQTSAGLIGDYISAAQQVATDVIGDRQAQATSLTVPVPSDIDQRGHIAGLPLGTRGGTLVPYYFPADGQYDLSAALFRPVDSEDRGVEGEAFPNEYEIAIDGVPVHTTMIGTLDDHQAAIANLTAAREAVAGRMKARVFVKAGFHNVAFTFVDQPSISQDTWEVPERASLDIHDGGGRPTLSSVAVAGPYDVSGVSDNPIRDRVLICRPKSAGAEEGCANKILATVATRAYRRPVNSTDMKVLMSFYQHERQAGAGFDAAIRETLPVVLTSPAFLFRSEHVPASIAPGVAYPVTDLELASRLSFFLWSSIPDEELMKQALAGRLHQPRVLEQQVKRMLADPRSEALTTNFPDQWLQLRNLAKTEPDVIEFQDWDGSLRDDMQKETELFFGYIVQQNKSALDLLNADYSFLNHRLADHYGVPGVYGNAFRLVHMQDPNRRGLLGQGSILALTSVATRTSVVFRGKWVLTALLNQPPLQPPPNVPALDSEAGAKTQRARLDLHTKVEPCASCHNLMDPIGFALENYGPTGRWRTTDGGEPIDASGKLLDGTPINGPGALSAWLSDKHPDVFVGTLTQNLMTYALGRGLDSYDMPVIRAIVDHAAKDHYRFQDLILGVVESKPFQERKKILETPPVLQQTAQVTGAVQE